MEIKRKEDRMEVLMSDVRLVACVSMASLVFTVATFVLVVVIFFK